MRNSTVRRLALLIDADNASHRLVEGYLAEACKHGTPTVRRIYGDWTTQHLSGWKDKLLDFSLSPIQQFMYTTGKNSTDSALIIDAMDLLHEGSLDGFCIVSSDCDFTRLAMRIRESGRLVIGIGEEKTPRPFVNACDEFSVLPARVQVSPPSETAALVTSHSQSKATDRALTARIKEAIDSCAQGDGWAHLATVGTKLKARGVQPQHHGHEKLSDLIRSLDGFAVMRAKEGPTRSTVLLVRNTG